MVTISTFGKLLLLNILQNLSKGAVGYSKLLQKSSIQYIYIYIISISSLFIPWSVFRKDVPQIPGDHIDVIDHVNSSVHIKHQTNTK